MADHTQHLGQFIERPLALFQCCKERDERFDRGLSAQLSKRAPGMQRRPDLQGVRKGPVQFFIARHADQFGYMFETRPQFQVVGPFLWRDVLPLPIRKQLIDGRCIAGTSTLHNITPSLPVSMPGSEKLSFLGRNNTEIYTLSLHDAS